MTVQISTSQKEPDFAMTVGIYEGAENVPELEWTAGLGNLPALMEQSE